MGLLTNREGSEGFAVFVTVFGLALLLTASLYLQRVERLNSKLNCEEVLNQNQNQNETQVPVEAETAAQVELCSNVSNWRLAAFLGILTGAVLILILPFLCCCVLCSVCGGCLFVCLILGHDLYADQNREREDLNADADLDFGTQRKKKNKYDLQYMPKRVRCWTNLIGWIVFLVSPLLSSGLIAAALYKYDALRTDNDGVYNTALAFFVTCLFNFTLFFQKMLAHFCFYLRNVALGEKKKIKRENTLARLHRLHRNRQRVGEENEEEEKENLKTVEEEDETEEKQTAEAESLIEKTEPEKQVETVQEK